MPMTPRQCLVKDPSPRSVPFGRVFINLTKLAKLTGLSKGFLSMMFSGKRNVSQENSKAIATALGLTTGQFVDALEAHVIELRKEETRQQKLKTSVDKWARQQGVR